MNNRGVWIMLIILFFIAGAGGSYFFMKHFDNSAKPEVQAVVQTQQAEGLDIMAVRLSVPKDGMLEMTERNIPRRIKSISIAEAVMEEFFKNGIKGSPVPENVKVLGIYRDAGQMLYLDLSDELRRNFQGDALSEYLIIKGIYETLSSNLQDFQDLKILIEGKEADTLGGHFQLKYPLKNMVTTETKTEGRPVQ